VKPSLVILSGERSGERLLLEDGKRYIIGRDQSADITLPEKRISRRHACIYWEAQSNRMVLEDLGSLNGTYVNSSAISGTKILQNGDRVQIGSHVLQLQFPEMSFLQEPDTKTDKRYKSRPSHISAAPSGDVFENIEPISDSLSRDLTGGRMINGRVGDIALADLLQMLAATKKTGQLILSDKKLARAPTIESVADGTIFVFLKDGDVEHALAEEYQGEDAFFLALKKNKGYFALFPFDADTVYEPSITMPLEALLLEGFRRLDEENAGRTKISPNDSFEVQPDEPLGSLNPDELTIFQTVWKHKKYSLVLENSAFDEEQTAAIVKKLLRSGFIKKKSKKS